MVQEGLILMIQKGLKGGDLKSCLDCLKGGDLKSCLDCLKGGDLKSDCSKFDQGSVKLRV